MFVAPGSANHKNLASDLATISAWAWVQAPILGQLVEVQGSLLTPYWYLVGYVPEANWLGHYLLFHSACWQCLVRVFRPVLAFISFEQPGCLPVFEADSKYVTAKWLWRRSINPGCSG